MFIDIINPKNNKVIGTMDRRAVHKTGAWHVAIHGNIIRYRKGTLQILVQKRSGNVDIAKNFFDQSVAIQAISGERNFDKILLRGVKEELGLDKTHLDFVMFNKRGKFLIEKTYNYDKRLKNNEVVHLYLIKTSQDPKPISNRVKSIKWTDWVNFVKLTHRPNYTKSVRLYTWDKQIREELEKAMSQFLNVGKIDDVRLNKGFRSFSTDKFFDL